MAVKMPRAPRARAVDGPKTGSLTTAVPALAPPAATEPSLSLPLALGWTRWVGLFLAYLSPASGLLLAYLYWQAPAGPQRRFSRWCLALAILGALLGSLFEAAHSGWQNGEWMIQPY